MANSILLKRMEDHKNAYLFWKEVGIFHSFCLHIDAHLDVCNCRAPSVTDDHGCDPLLNCANFLSFAMREKRIDTFVWILPPHLLPAPLQAQEDLACGSQAFLSWVRDEIQRWNRLSIEELQSIQLHSSGTAVVQAKIQGCDWLVCTLSEFHKISEQLYRELSPGQDLVLDIDVDYFCAPNPKDGYSDLIWQTPWQLLQMLGLDNMPIAAVTVADSISGGYTPVEYRFLGDLSELCCLGQQQVAQEFWEIWRSGAECPDDAPDWLQASCLARRFKSEGLARPWRELGERYPDYQDRTIDLAARLFQRLQFEQANRMAEKISDAGAADIPYLKAILAVRQGRFEEAVAEWKSMLALSGRERLDENTRCHILELLGRFCLEMGSSYYAEACRHYRECLEIDRRDCDALRGLAEAELGLGQMDTALRHLRRVVSLEPQQVSTLSAVQRLIEIYQQTGQVGLAENLRQRYPRDVLLAAQTTTARRQTS